MSLRGTALRLRRHSAPRWADRYSFSTRAALSFCVALQDLPKPQHRANRIRCRVRAAVLYGGEIFRATPERLHSPRCRVAGVISAAHP